MIMGVAAIGNRQQASRQRIPPSPLSLHITVTQATCREELASNTEGQKRAVWCKFGAKRAHQRSSPMARRKRASADRFRVGKVTVYLHHRAWWVYYSEGRERVRRKVSESREEAKQLAAQINAQVAQGAPT